MSSKRNNLYKSRFLATFVFIISVMLLPINRAKADDVLNRYIRLGSSFTSEVTDHEFGFDTVTPGNIGSVGFLYCSNSPLFDDPCTPPAGMDATNAVIDSETGLSGFAVSGSTTASHLIITRAPAFEAPVSAAFNFDDITNPSTPQSVNFVRISVYDNVDGTGAVLDQGSVAFNLEDPFAVQAFVPPYLTFCVGVTVELNCSNASGFLGDFGEFSPVTPRTVTTQFSAATNDPTGYNTFVTGQTMTSGANIIPALAAATSSQPGISQFGINLRQNTNPPVGANVQSGAVANGGVDPDYNTPNQFKYISGDRIAGSSMSTGFNRYTVAYLVNVSSDQKPGVYASTFNYTAIASF